MMLNDRGELSPFGWAVIVAGRPREQTARSVDELAHWSEAAWTRHFPADRGYRTSTQVLSGSTRGVQLTVHRGDFRAEATVEHDAPAPVSSSERGANPGGEGHARAAGTRNASVRVFGRARFRPMNDADDRAERASHIGRITGSSLGLAGFFTLGWLMIGVNDPIYVLGGMLLVVALIMALTAGALLGAWVGERVGASYRDRARRTIEGSPGFESDVRRWKAVSRQLLAQRSTLGARRAQPFRSEPSSLAS
ncbi:MAG: hypothetical protein AB1Z98_32615 [Nannocystaceae bacterium]